MATLWKHIKEAAKFIWDIIGGTAFVLAIGGAFLLVGALYAESLIFTIPILIIVGIIKGIKEDDQQKKRFEGLDKERVKTYPKDEYGKPLWDDLDVFKSAESLLVETNNNTKAAKAYAKEQIDMSIKRLEQIDNQDTYYNKLELEKTKYLANIDKWNDIIKRIEKVDKDKKKYKANKAIKIILAAIITAGLIALIALIISTFFNSSTDKKQIRKKTGSKTEATQSYYSKNNSASRTYTYSVPKTTNTTYSPTNQQYFNESVRPISSSSCVENSITTTTVAQTITISELYKKSADRGVLKAGMTEQQFRENISTEEGLRSYYDYATTKGGMKFHPYDEFKQRIGWEKEFAHSRYESEELKQMLLLSDEIEIYRDIDEEYYNHPESYQLPQQKKAPTVQGQYKAAIREGLLDPSVTEEQFVEILLDKHMRKAYFDNSNKIIPNAYGDYDSFCKGVDRVLAAYKIRTNTPTKKTPTVQGQYELAKENGLLHKSVTQEGFAEFLKDATKRKEYYDYVQNKKPGFYSEWETFNNNVDVMLANYKPNTTPQPTVTTNTTTTYKEERMVYICTGPSSYRYHRRKSCRGLNRCSGDIERVTVSEARDLDRTPCGYCY